MQIPPARHEHRIMARTIVGLLPLDIPVDELVTSHEPDAQRAVEDRLQYQQEIDSEPIPWVRNA